MTDRKLLRVIGLQTSNVGCLTAVTIRPRRHMNVVKGANNQGKSTVFLAMKAALEGKKALPDCPIRRGETKAKTRLELGPSADEAPVFIVEQTITESGETVTVKSSDGAKYPSPRTLLSGLCQHIAFNPKEFALAEPKEQDKILKALVGLDFSELDRKRLSLYDDRTIVNRETKSLEAIVDSMRSYPEAPTKELVVSELVAELDELRETIAVNNAARQEVASLERQEQAARDAVGRCDQEIARIKAELAKAEERRAACVGQLEVATTAAAKGREDAAQLEDPDTAPLKAQIAGAEDINRQVRANADRAKLAKELEAKKDQSEKLTADIQAIDDQKQSMIAAAEFPIQGLGFSEVGPTYNGIPIKQASESQKLIIGAAIGAALHPRLNTMWLDEASGLDDDTMDALATYAEEHDLQVFVEMVRTNDPAAIEIRDGTVVEKKPEAAE